MIGPYRIHGHAIVSRDDCIADAEGRTPPVLRNDADWQRFQAALDVAAVTVLGRLSHESNPNFKERRRIVVSGKAKGIERRADAWWWNPADAPVLAALAAAAPGGGIVAVPGGRAVFDLFLALGFDEFHLARATRVRLGSGTLVFSECNSGLSADAVLARHGLVAGSTEQLDRAAGVTLTLFSRPLDGKAGETVS
jgi:hypothetical protein